MIALKLFEIGENCNVCTQNSNLKWKSAWRTLVALNIWWWWAHTHTHSHTGIYWCRITIKSQIKFELHQICFYIHITHTTKCFLFLLFKQIQLDLMSVFSVMRFLYICDRSKERLLSQMYCSWDSLNCHLFDSSFPSSGRRFKCLANYFIFYFFFFIQLVNHHKNALIWFFFFFLCWFDRVLIILPTSQGDSWM